MKSIDILACTFCLVALAPGLQGQHFDTLYTVAGDNPLGLAWAGDVLYGTTANPGGAGFNCGTAYRVRPPATEDGPWVGTVLYSFPNVVGDPCSPAGAPVVGVDGTLYGIASAGIYFSGALYDLQPPEQPGAGWSENTLYNFGVPGTNVTTPASNIVPGPAGSYYVLTQGGSSAPPVLCQLQPPTSPGTAWTATVLYSFPNGPDGVALNSLIGGPVGVLYGTSPGGPGAVFQLTPPTTPDGAWTETVVHQFGENGTVVDNPIGLTVAANGTIYGTAYGYDPPLGSGYSTIFRLTPPAAPGGQWAYANLTTPTKTEHFNTPVTLANGRLYGGISTGTGGSIFELERPSISGGTWTMTTLYTFTDGQIPSGNLVAGPHGAIYGATAAAPGQPSGGTVFAITME